MKMFCRQCEQTQGGVACTTIGICGKSPQAAAAQDALVEVLKSVSVWAVAARKAGATAEDMKAANEWSLRAAFSTMTNVNFSDSRIAEYVHQGIQINQGLKEFILGRNGGLPEATPISELNLSPDTPAHLLEEFGRSVGVMERAAKMGNDDAFFPQ